MVQLDWSTGEILKVLDEQGLTDNTLVIFSSDNGPVYDDGYVDGTTVHTSTEEVDRGHDGSGPYRGGKYLIYEGGTRVPFIVKWPGQIEPGRTDALFSQIDLLASFAALLDVELTDDQAIDSRNNLAALLGRDRQGLPYMVEEARGLALRQGPWKFIARQGQSAASLYNLQADLGEQTNVIDEHPDVAEKMREKLEQLVQAKQGVRQIDE